MENVLISEGKTNSLILPAVIGLFTGGVTCVFVPIAGIILLAFPLASFWQQPGWKSMVPASASGSTLLISD